MRLRLLEIEGKEGLLVRNESYLLKLGKTTTVLLSFWIFFKNKLNIYLKQKE